MNPKTVEANLILDHVRQYLNGHSYVKDGAFLSFAGYIRMMIDASKIIDNAQAAVNKPEPARVGVIDVLILDASDIRRMMFKVLKASIADENVVGLLPFATSLEYGDNFVHIVNASLYPVKTKYHLIETGDTLCARRDRASRRCDTYVTPTCKGCLAKAKGVIVNHLLTIAEGDYLKVAEALASLQ